jgi:hypothetical protein
MSITDIILECLESFKKNGCTAKSINDGKCDHFALAVQAKFPKAALWYDHIKYETPGGFSHCYLRYKGLCYDSEAVQGVKKMSQLPFYQREIK